LELISWYFLTMNPFLLSFFCFPLQPTNYIGKIIGHHFLTQWWTKHRGNTDPIIQWFHWKRLAISAERDESAHPLRM
jgi:hypothetical protein